MLCTQVYIGHEMHTTNALDVICIPFCHTMGKHWQSCCEQEQKRGKTHDVFTEQIGTPENL